MVKQTRTGDELAPVNLNFIEMKHLVAKWIVRMFEHISINPHLVLALANYASIILSIIDTFEHTGIC